MTIVSSADKIFQIACLHASSDFCGTRKWSSIDGLNGKNNLLPIIIMPHHSHPGLPIVSATLPIIIIDINRLTVSHKSTGNSYMFCLWTEHGHTLSQQQNTCFPTVASKFHRVSRPPKHRQSHRCAVINFDSPSVCVHFKINKFSQKNFNTDY